MNMTLIKGLIIAGGAAGIGVPGIYYGYPYISSLISPSSETDIQKPLGETPQEQSQESGSIRLADNGTITTGDTHKDSETAKDDQKTDNSGSPTNGEQKAQDATSPNSGEESNYRTEIPNENSTGGTGTPASSRATTPTETVQNHNSQKK